MTTVFVAGGSGAIGLPLVRALAAAGYHVVATTRSPGRQEALAGAGATPAVVDALDAGALEAAVRAAKPTHVIHQLTALPKAGPRSARDLAATNRLRIEGTRNLLQASIAAGAKRFVAGSFAPIADLTPEAAGAGADAVAAVQSMESQVLEAARRQSIEGIVLRYGMFYGPGNPGTQEMIALVRRRRLPAIRRDRGRLPFIHIDDAVAATVAALERGASGRIYHIVDDRPASFSELVRELAAAAGAPRPFEVPVWLLRLLMPYAAGLLSLQVQASNQTARAELGWQPAFPSLREGLRQTLDAAR